MKTVKAISLAVVLAQCATTAYASGYHMSTTNLYKGTLTIQSTGSCKMKQIFEEVSYGYILDGNNVTVGNGMLSADGQNILAIESGYEYISGVYYATGKNTQIFFTDFAEDAIATTIESLALCSVTAVIPSAKSKKTYNYDPAKSINATEVNFAFNGISPYLRSSVNGITKDKAQAFVGKMIFKGNKI